MVHALHDGLESSLEGALSSLVDSDQFLQVHLSKLGSHVVTCRLRLPTRAHGAAAPATEETSDNPKAAQIVEQAQAALTASASAEELLVVLRVEQMAVCQSLNCLL